MKLNLLRVGLLVAATAIAADCQIPNGADTPAFGSQAQVFQKDAVMKSFATGGTLAQGMNYRVMTGRHTTPGEVEIHRKFTDVFYIVRGKAIIVTGGNVVGETGADSDEPRGASIEGGESRQLSPGDVVVIPAGVPHWIKSVKGTFLYFVVKAKDPAQ